MKRPRLTGAAVAALIATAAVSIVLADAARRRSDRAAVAARNEAVVRLVGLPDLALSSSARWLRHPSQAEPGAAMADLPASLDVDPAGALIGPPRELLRVGGVAIVRRRAGARR